jgi:hypothetical protein
MKMWLTEGSGVAQWRPYSPEKGGWPAGFAAQVTVPGLPLTFFLASVGENGKCHLAAGQFFFIRNPDIPFAKMRSKRKDVFPWPAPLSSERIIPFAKNAFREERVSSWAAPLNAERIIPLAKNAFREERVSSWAAPRNAERIFGKRYRLSERYVEG